MQNCHGGKHRNRNKEPLVSLHVLLEVILTTKELPEPGQGAAEGLDLRVDPLVPGELLFPNEALPALRKGTLIWPLSYKSNQGQF